MKKGHEWTEEQADSAKKPNYSKLYVIKPALLKLMGDLEGKAVVELGSGSGYWSQIVLDNGARKYVGVEISENQLAVAREENDEGKARYIQGDATKQTSLEDDYFDIALIEHVVLEISEREKLHSLFREAHRVLKQDGVLMLSDIHPFAPYANLPNIKTDDSYNYFDSGHPFEVISTKPDGSKVHYTDFHWTVSDLTHAVHEAGFKLDKIYEPDPSDELVEKYSYLEYRKGKSLAFMLRAVK